MAAGPALDADDAAASGSPPLPEATARLGARALASIGTRIELAGVELAAARERVLVSLLLIGAALACGMLALAAASLGVIAYFWDTARFTAIILVSVAYAVATAVLWGRFAALRRDAPPLLGSTVEALQRDAERLAGERQSTP